MSWRFLDDGNQRRADVDVGTAADLSDEISFLALVYMIDVTAGSTINYLWKDCHARGFGRAADSLYIKFNGTGGTTLHEVQTASGILQLNAWQWVAFTYNFTTSARHFYWAELGRPLEEVTSIAFETNTRSGKEDNTTEPMRIASRQLATYNYDRNWDNDVAIGVYWNGELTIDQLRLQQDMLYPREGSPLFMHVFDASTPTVDSPDLTGNGYDAVPNNAQAGTVMPTTIMRAAASDPMSIITHRSALIDPGDQGRVGDFAGSSNGAREKTLVVKASITADTVFHLRFDMPPQLPSGTAKLRLRPTAVATSGSAKVNPKWLSVAGDETADPTAGSYNAEGTTTITWTGTDSEKQKAATKIVLDADTVVAEETIYMLLTFETTSWTLAADSYWRVDIIFE